MLPPLLVVCVRSDTLRTQRGDKHVDKLFASSHLARSTRPLSSRRPTPPGHPSRALPAGPSAARPHGGRNGGASVTTGPSMWTSGGMGPARRAVFLRPPAVPASTARSHPQPAPLSRHVV